MAITPTHRTGERGDSDERLRELILYIVNKTADCPVGDVKLNKILYFSDFVSYAELGASISGAVYRKSQYGPTARRLLPVRERMEAEGDCAVQHPPIGGGQRDTVPQRAADTSYFTEDQLKLVDDVIAGIDQMTATQASNFSHDASLGWQLAQMGESIPYETAMLSTGPVSDRAREIAAQRFGT